MLILADKIADGHILAFTATCAHLLTSYIFGLENKNENEAAASKNDIIDEKKASSAADLKNIACKQHTAENSQVDNVTKSNQLVKSIAKMEEAIEDTNVVEEKKEEDPKIFKLARHFGDHAG